MFMTTCSSRKKKVLGAVVALALIYVISLVWASGQLLKYYGGEQEDMSNQPSQQVEMPNQPQPQLGINHITEIINKERNLRHGEKTIETDRHEASNSATGTLFHGEKIRDFPGGLKFNGWEPLQPAAANDNAKTCSRWNVVTTIFAPSTAVKRAALMPNWCTVIVADTKTPKDYMETSGLSGDSIHFISIEEQEQWAESTGTKSIIDFVSSTPYSHFARKNIGYLYAVRHGAEFIFDFDDDNIVSEGAVLLANETHLEDARMVLLGPSVFNHHKLMGATVEISWPRGFPLEHVQNPAHSGNIAYRMNSEPMESIAVMQLCADIDPDIDAVHRLVHPLPMKFSVNQKLLVPTHAFVPYNAQATLHTKHALWALFLPSTVAGRVSDIWRGYFAQALFRDVGLQVAILPPDVTQERNAHNYLGDLQSELDLYFKAGKLIEFLSSWESTAKTIPERMEQLWVALYEHDYIKLDDVFGVQLWLQALIDIGYNFPTLRLRKIHNVVLMGQFNYAQEASDVVFWNQKWKRWFNNIVVVGPFVNSTIRKLKLHGIEAHASLDDAGMVSPMGNLARSLKKYLNNSKVDGVLSLHDDAFLNMKYLHQPLIEGRDEVIVTHSNITGSPRSSLFLIQHKDGLSKFKLLDGTPVETVEELLKSIGGWAHWPRCIQSFSHLYEDPRSAKYREEDGSFLVTRQGQSNFVYVPTKYATEFEQAASLMVYHDVFLECGFPKIVDILQQRANATVRKVSLCTAFPSKGELNRGELAMVETCTFDRYTLNHPFKLRQLGYKKWSDTFDAMESRAREEHDHVD